MFNCKKLGKKKNKNLLANIKVEKSKTTYSIFLIMIFLTTVPFLSWWPRNTIETLVAFETRFPTFTWEAWTT